jgi:hypothetical protein
MREPPHPSLPVRPRARPSGRLRWASGLCGTASRCGQLGHGDRCWDMATDMDAVAAVLRRVADGDDAILADPETFSTFKQARRDESASWYA